MQCQQGGEVKLAVVGFSSGNIARIVNQQEQIQNWLLEYDSGIIDFDVSDTVNYMDVFVADDITKYSKVTIIYKNSVASEWNESEMFLISAIASPRVNYVFYGASQIGRITIEGNIFKAISYSKLTIKKIIFHN